MMKTHQKLHTTVFRSVFSVHSETLETVNTLCKSTTAVICTCACDVNDVGVLESLCSRYPHQYERVLFSNVSTLNSAFKCMRF